MFEFRCHLGSNLIHIQIFTSIWSHQHFVGCRQQFYHCLASNAHILIKHPSRVRLLARMNYHKADIYYRLQNAFIGLQNDYSKLYLPRITLRFSYPLTKSTNNNSQQNLSKSKSALLNVVLIIPISPINNCFKTNQKG